MIGKKVAIIIPAFNESGSIGSVVTMMQNKLSKQPNITFEIIVIDDGSSDDTAKRVSKAGTKVIRHILNCGAGGATATGLSYAQQNGFDLAATMDADGQHDPDDVLRGINLMLESGGDLIIGSRLMDADGMSKIKILGNHGLSLITGFLFGVNVTDSQSGLRIFSRRALDNLKWKTNGYEFCSEMLWRAKQHGMSIKEYPIKAIYTDYSVAKPGGQNNWNGFNIVKSLAQRRLMEIFGE